MWRFIFFIFISFRIFLFLIEEIAFLLLPKYKEFLGPITWANFDGGHYLKIADYGYGLYQQAFFPLFPLTIHILSQVIHNTLLSAIIIVHISFLVTLIILYKLVRVDWDDKTARLTLIFFVLFPTSFFLTSIYTESFFMVFLLGSFYAARKEKWFFAAVLGMLAAATKFIGIFLLPALLIEWARSNNITLKHFFKKNIYTNKRIIHPMFFLFLIPLGLLFYMIYLQISVYDPLAFIHTQSAFGANRTSGDIILLPQVFYRYVQIFLHVSPQQYTFWIALLEFFLFIFSLSMLIRFKKKIRLSYLIFAFFAIIVPTITGTLSSIPRYILVAFPLFITYALLENKKIQVVFLIGNTILLVILTMLFAQGYFVA